MANVGSGPIDPNGGYSLSQSGVYNPGNAGWGAAATVAKKKPVVAAPKTSPYPGTTPTAPTGGAAPQTTPDYTSLYQAALNTPNYQQALAGSNAYGAGIGADRSTAIQQALAQFGEVPADFQDKYGDVTDTTRQLASQNTTSGLSTIARLNQARDDAQRQLLHGLAARGARRTGTRGYGLRRGQLTYDQSRNDALQKLLGGTAGIYSNYANQAYNNTNGLSAALQAAINAVAPYWTQPSSLGTAAPPAPGAPSYASGPVQTSSYSNLGYANTGNLAAALAGLTGRR